MMKIHSLGIVAVLAFAGFGGTALAIGAGERILLADGPLTCAIDVSPRNQMVEIQGVVLADTAVSGSYNFEVRSSGSSGNSNVRQGGGFSAEAGKPATLGKVMLGGSGGYDVKLDIDANGESVTCDQRVG